MQLHGGRKDLTNLELVGDNLEVALDFLETVEGMRLSERVQLLFEVLADPLLLDTEFDLFLLSGKV